MSRVECGFWRCVRVCSTVVIERDCSRGKSTRRNLDGKKTEVHHSGVINESLLTVSAMFLNNLHNTCNARGLAIRVIEERQIAFKHHAHVIARYNTQVSERIIDIA